MYIFSADYFEYVVFFNKISEFSINAFSIIQYALTAGDFSGIYLS